jgi:hypothetical protein
MTRARSRTLSVIAGGALLTGGLGTAAATSAAAAPPAAPSVVASGLNNPRHLTFAGNRLLVAESGSGGSGPCIISSEGGQVCYGATGSITEVTTKHGTWRQRRVVTGLPSLAPPADDAANGVTKGGSATGPSDVDTFWGRYVVSVGLGAPPTARNQGQATVSASSSAPATLPKGFGTLLLTGGDRGPWWRHQRHEQLHVLADIAAHEQATNPVDDPDSNPAALLRVGASYVVADAGGNSIVSAGLFGRVRTIASFPDQMVQAPGAPAGVLMPMQFVPTSVARYRGHLYVSQLTGYPFPQGGSTVWRLDAAGHATPYATGLTNVTDLAFAPDGTLYAVEISAGGLASTGPIGALVRIPAGGGAAQTVAGGLFAPYGLALHRGSAYVTTGSVLPGGGEVVRIPLG